MEVIEYDRDNCTIKDMIISYRFTGLEDIVCSGSCLYQLPTQIGKKSFDLKKLEPRYHQGSIVYLIRSRRINVKELRRIAYKTQEFHKLETISYCSF